MRSVIVLIMLGLILYGCEEGGLLIESDISGEELVLISPLGGAEVASNAVSFNWEGIGDATAYEIQVAQPNFKDTAQLLLNAQDSTTTVTLEMNPGDYEWRVRAMNSNSATEYSSAKFSVVPVENFSDNLVILTAPINNLITNEVTQNLRWEAVQGATLYRIQVLENGSIVQEQPTSNTNFDLTFPEGDLTWQVRAENGTDNTLYSARDILIDATPPNTPVLTAPEDNSFVVGSLVSFEWTRDMIAGSIEGDSIFLYRDKQLTNIVIEDEAESPFLQTLEDGTYYWFVRAFDAAGNIGTQSGTFSFTVNTP